MSNFDSEIRDNPFKLLDAIKNKMYDPARAKYECASLTESIVRALLNTKQEFDEDLIDYTKRFKQAKDIFQQTVGDEILHKFVENAKDYKDLERAATQSGGSSTPLTNLKKKSFSKWMTHLFMKNADSTRYGSLMTKFSAEFALGNTEICPESIDETMKVI